MPAQTIKVSLNKQQDEFSRADLVFSGVDHSGPSFEAKVYLDNPAADARTPRDPDQGFAGSFYVFGHGGCFGDEGHCDIPTAPASAFDRRGPHQLTPGTKVVIATESIRRALREAKKNAITVTIVPILRTSRSQAHDTGALLQFEELALLTYL